MPPRTVKAAVTTTRSRATKAARSQNQTNTTPVLGNHPSPPNLFGEAFIANDTDAENAIFHRSLSEQEGKREMALVGIRKMLVQHHASSQMWQATQQRREAIARLGFETSLPPLPRIPKNDDTQKCNLAEILLAEYLIASTSTQLPVYRLHHNPNYDQSMKGDDVLAFDFSSNSARIIVGEAKFRGESRTKFVREIIDSLEKSNRLGAPISLGFIGDKLANTPLGEQVYNCSILFALNKLRLDYVGLLMSDLKSSERITSDIITTLQNLAMITLSIKAPTNLVDDCYRNLEDECLSPSI